MSLTAGLDYEVHGSVIRPKTQTLIGFVVVLERHMIMCSPPPAPVTPLSQTLL